MVWHFKTPTIWLVFDNILFRLDLPTSDEEDEETSDEDDDDDGIPVGALTTVAPAG